MRNVEKYLKQVQEDPTKAETWYGLGDAYFKAGQYEESLDAFEEASLIDLHNVDLLCRIGDVAYLLGFYQETIKALLKVLEISSGNAVIWRKLGDVYLASGENNQYDDPVSGRTINFYDNDDDFFYAQSIFFFEKALASMPANQDIINRLIIACSKLTVYYWDRKPENEDMLKTLHKASDYLAQYDADLMVQQQKLSQPQIDSEKQEVYFLSLDAAIESWLLPMAKNKRNMDILMYRMGWSSEGSKTLHEIGALYGLTRERVRQIESGLMSKIQKKSAITELLPLWSAINFIVESLGILDLQDLGQQLMNYFKWDRIPSSEGLENIISLHPTPVFTLTKEGSSRFLILKSLPCIECESIAEYLKTRLSGGQIAMTSAISSFVMFCKAKCTYKHPKNLTFSSTFIRYMILNNKHLRTYLKEEGDVLYTTDLWKLFHGRLLSASEAVLKLNSRAMHFTEIANKLIEAKRDGVSARNIHASLDRSSVAFLWDRGTFIHQEHIPRPTELLKKIETWIEDKLKQNIPLVSAYGVFNVFRQDCLNTGIPNEVALYSCLRMSANAKFVYPDYPNIYLSATNEFYSSLSAIEKFIHDAGSPVPIEELRQYALVDLGFREFQLTSALDKNANILRSGRGEYLHIDYLNIEESKLNEIISYVKNILLGQQHVSIEKVFHDKIIDCKLMGVDSPVLLFSVMQLHATDISLSHYPQICPCNTGEESITRGIMTSVVEYIKSKVSFCTYQELYEYFVNELGYSKNTVYAALNHSEIYRYLQGCVIHKETLGWKEAKQAQLEQIAFSVYEEALNLGQCYGLISDLIESPGLPSLEHNIDWTQLLITELLKKGNNFNIIGNAKGVFVPKINSKHIESVEDLIYEILRSKYKGSANLTHFAEELVDLGIIVKGITKSMIGESRRVSIIGQEIVLSELMRNA